ncbi:hypothetical protein [Methylobacterium nodulans]|uniref:hypothetical protein n=1 Tax=Methylobacterium nodulans TaxID=114616 RepID=UPI0005C21636|nr:hypothetical protein [Methylobacterium nodulans]
MEESCEHLLIALTILPFLQSIEVRIKLADVVAQTLLAGAEALRRHRDGRCGPEPEVGGRLRSREHACRRQRERVLA